MEKPPAHFWTAAIALASLALSAFGMLIGAGKADVTEAKSNERRICRIEAVMGIGDCKR